MKPSIFVFVSLSLSLFGVSVPAASEPVGPQSSALSLEGAVKLAIESNPTLRAARFRVEGAAGRAVTARLWPNPKLEASAEDVSVDDDGFDRAEILLGLSQTVPFPGKKGLDADMGRAGIRVSEAEYLLLRNALVRDVKLAYFQTVSAERRHEIVSDLLDVSRALSETVGKQVGAGDAAAQQLIRAEIERDRMQAQLVAVEREVVESRHALGVVLGRPIGDGTVLSRELAGHDEGGFVTEAGTVVVEDHPRRERAQAERELAELALRRERMSALPDVTLGAAVGRNRGSDEKLAELRVSLPLPLIDRGQGRTREARAGLAAAEASLAAVEQELAGDLASTRASVHALSGQVALYAENIIPRADRALRIVREGFEQGKFGFLDLLDTRRTLAETRLTYEEKLYELNVARSRLEFLLAAGSGRNHSPPTSE